ncbi:MAG: DUF922 domain-containing protein [Paracoccaceae bacterium]
MKVNLKIPGPSNKTWTVKGANLEEVFKALKAHGWWGRYRSNESAKFTGKAKKFDTVNLSAKPVITMPKWANYGKAAKDEKKSWDDMWKALKKHEDQHHTIFQTAAKEWKASTEKGGDLEPKEMDKAWKAFLADSQKRQDDFDKRTGHGKKTGVVL